MLLPLHRGRGTYTLTKNKLSKWAYALFAVNPGPKAFLTNESHTGDCSVTKEDALYMVMYRAFCAFIAT